MARSLVWRVLVARLANAGVGAALTATIATAPAVEWVPGLALPATTGLAALGVIAAAGSAGSLVANGAGQGRIEKRSAPRVLVTASVVQMVVAACLVLAVACDGLASIGVAGLAGVTFLLAVAAPGLAGLSRAWWHALDLDQATAARGGALDPTLSAIAWSVGPAVAAPLALLTPWTVPVLVLLGAGGLALLARLPDPYPPCSVVTGPPASGDPAPIATPDRVADWWMAGSYAFYHAARALLGTGSAAALVTAGQPGLIGAASAAPSAGHAVAGVAYAAKRNPNASLLRAVMVGLSGQAGPTLAIAGALLVWPTMSAAVAAVVVVGGDFVAGVLKAPVAAAVYPLALESRPHVNAGRSAARIAQGMTVGGLVGPLVGTAIVTTLGPAALLPTSVVCLAVCAVGVRLDARVSRAGSRAS